MFLLSISFHILLFIFFFFFFNDTATTEIYTLSLHDALPISLRYIRQRWNDTPSNLPCGRRTRIDPRSEEHTSELQSQSNLVCRLLLEKKKKNKTKSYSYRTSSNDRYKQDAR